MHSSMSSPVIGSGSSNTEDLDKLHDEVPFTSASVVAVSNAPFNQGFSWLGLSAFSLTQRIRLHLSATIFNCSLSSALALLLFSHPLLGNEVVWDVLSRLLRVSDCAAPVSSKNVLSSSCSFFMKTVQSTLYSCIWSVICWVVGSIYWGVLSVGCSSYHLAHSCIVSTALS